MKSIFFFSITFFLSFSSWAKCFKEPMINDHLEKYLKMKCQNFEEIIPEMAMTLKINKALTIWAEDILRLKNLYWFKIYGKGNPKVIFKGNVDFSEIKNIAFDNVAIDLFQGEILPKKITYLSLTSMENLNLISPFLKFDNLTLNINGKPIDGLSINNGNSVVTIYNCSTLSKSVIKAREFQIDNIGRKKCLITDAKLEITERFKIWSTIIGENTFIKLKNSVLELGSSSSIGVFPLSKDSKIKSFYANHSQTEFKCPNCFENVEFIKILKSSLKELKLPEKMHKIYDMHIGDSSIKLSALPQMPALKILKINGADLENVRSLTIGKKLWSIDLMSSGLRDIGFKLENSKALRSIYLFNNPLTEVSFSDGSEKLPATFAMYVDKKSIALKIRKEIKREGVAFWE